jgi:hypothetical protein
VIGITHLSPVVHTLSRILCFVPCLPLICSFDLRAVDYVHHRACSNWPLRRSQPISHSSTVSVTYRSSWSPICCRQSLQHISHASSKTRTLHRTKLKSSGRSIVRNNRRSVGPRTRRSHGASCTTFGLLTWMNDVSVLLHASCRPRHDKRVTRALAKSWSSRRPPPNKPLPRSEQPSLPRNPEARQRCRPFVPIAIARWWIYKVLKPLLASNSIANE